MGLSHSTQTVRRFLVSVNHKPTSIRVFTSNKSLYIFSLKCLIATRICHKSYLFPTSCHILIAMGRTNGQTFSKASTVTGQDAGHCNVYSALCIAYSTTYAVYSTTYAVCCVQYNVCCMLCTVQCMLYAVYSGMYAVCCTQYNVCCMLYTVQRMLYAVHSTMYAVCCVQYNVC